MVNGGRLVVQPSGQLVTNIGVSTETLYKQAKIKQLESDIDIVHLLLKYTYDTVKAYVYILSLNPNFDSV